MPLLYDFSEEEQNSIKDLPIWGPIFPYDSLPYKHYFVHIDKVGSVQTSDGSDFQSKNVSVQDTLRRKNDADIIPHRRTIIENVGFADGGLHYTQHWETGVYICEEFANYVGKLRCFEKKGTVYNFVGYPFDSSWLTSSNSEQIIIALIEIGSITAASCGTRSDMVGLC